MSRGFSASPSSDPPPDLASRLAQFGQTHVLRWWSELNAPEREQLVGQLSAVDLELLARLHSGKEEATDWAALAARAEPPPAIRLGEAQPRYAAAVARARGEEALRAGRLGMILVAGGQGSRLGFEHPKGMFPLGPVSGRTLFQILIDRLQAVARRYRTRIPLYVMTSPATHAETERYFAEQHRFGLEPTDVRLFCQGTMPAVDALSGRLLMESRSSLCLSPDGHGGMLSAFAGSGCLPDVRQRNITQLFYGQIDNPLLEVCSPDLIGYHLLAKSELTTQVVAKQRPEEKVGVVTMIDGKVQIIEYSDLPAEAAALRQSDGSLRHWAGSMAVHVMDVDFLARVAAAAGGLPFHKAQKKVACLDEAGTLRNPTANNAIKFERFIFDLLPLARGAMVIEADPAEAFAPVKNAKGQPADTPERSQRAMAAAARRMLRSAGAEVGDGVAVEIQPQFALDAAELRAKIPAGLVVTRPTYFHE